jgi:hypothetical protein
MGASVERSVRWTAEFILAALTVAAPGFAQAQEHVNELVVLLHPTFKASADQVPAALAQAPAGLDIFPAVCARDRTGRLVAPAARVIVGSNVANLADWRYVLQVKQPKAERNKFSNTMEAIIPCVLLYRESNTAKPVELQKYDLLLAPGTPGRIVQDLQSSFYGGCGIAPKIYEAVEEPKPGRPRPLNWPHAIPVTDFDEKAATIKLKNQWPLAVHVEAMEFLDRGGRQLTLAAPGQLVQNTEGHWVRNKTRTATMLRTGEERAWTIQANDWQGFTPRSVSVRISVVDDSLSPVK